MAKRSEGTGELQRAIDAIEPRSPEDRYVFTIELRQPWKDRLRKAWLRAPSPYDETEVESWVEMLLCMGIESYERELDAQEKMDAEWEASLTPEERRAGVDDDDIPF